MAEFKLDRIRFRWKNVWAISTSYVKDDIVTYKGKAYVCLIGHSSNSANFYQDLEAVEPLWELMFDGFAWTGDWQASRFYNLGELIKWKGYVYRCIIPHTSTAVLVVGPTSDFGKWVIVATTYNWLDTWTVNAYYDLGDIITYNGITYICNTKHRAAANIALGLEADQSKWDIVTRSDSWRSDWAINTRYRVDDIVRYGGIVYRCILFHTSAATATLGLEANIGNWEIVTSGIEYKTAWTATTRYKVNDIVKWGPSLWRCVTAHTSQTSLINDEPKWNVWLPGLGYEVLWNQQLEYRKGDIVLYGGYSYTALQNNTNVVPSVNGIIQDTGSWELLKEGYSHRGEWSSLIAYRTGDVIRNNGYLYVAVADSTATFPDLETTWKKLVTGIFWKAEWVTAITYFIGDIVTFESTSFYCVARHSSATTNSRPDQDVGNVYWIVYIQGTSTNVLTTKGDIKTYLAGQTARYPIGAPGNLLKALNNAPTWENFEETPNVYYVAPSGTDFPTSGKTLNAPFKTVKYATEYILEDELTRAPATIFIKTGFYEEALPITVPANVALVGDELRSTNILPAPSYEDENMFYVRNGSGIRNMTLQGLSGTLGPVNEFLTSRPTAGAYVSLDPTGGPENTANWITTKSPYVQNVTTFGTGCIGMKIDGSVHNGGNKSIVANDFTQVLDDGIGYWATEGGRSELVSVFTYFCYIGYLATSGGILRATNGNNSYGTYGSRAEGVNLNETPITALIDNRSTEAQVDIIHTNGFNVLAYGYSHAGQNYSSATNTLTGPGVDFSSQFTEFRDNAISQIRVLSTSPTAIPGGLNYQVLLNNAQDGTPFSITIAAADVNEDPETYIGLRVFIESGKGVGQYGFITNYDVLSKVATISRERDGGEGWEHIYPGYPIESTLDSTTRYRIEPRVVVNDPPVSSTTISAVGDYAWEFIARSNNYYVAISAGADIYSTRSTDGVNWSTPSLVVANSQATGLVWTGQNFVISSTGPTVYIIRSINQGESWITQLEPEGDQVENYDIATDGNGTVIITGVIVLDPPVNAGFHFVDRSINHGASWTRVAIKTINSSNPIDLRLGPIAYGNGIWTVLTSSGLEVVFRSTDGGETWVQSEVDSTPDTYKWNQLTYGNGRFVAISDNVAVTYVGYSFNGAVWFIREPVFSDPVGLKYVSYGAGVFVATGTTNAIALSQDGRIWRTQGTDSISFVLPSSGTWGRSVYHNGSWIVVRSNDSNWARVFAGAQAVIRARVESSRITKFVIYDPGSNYTSMPMVNIVDPVSTVNAVFDIRMANGVLAQPLFTNRGNGYVTATATISGNGFADIFQTGNIVKVNNLSRVPGPGDNLTIDGIDTITYKITSVITFSGTEPSITATLRITPSISNFLSPTHGTDIVIRQSYSQIRLTGHDFLDIGTGNVSSTRYPQLYVEGIDSENEPQQDQEVTEVGGGRVFYTSTDQDGNFRVGELFKVEQSTGIVSVNADFFDLQGLTELSLGGIQVGGTAVVIREFSKDGAFIANSNSIIPTQAAIIKYLESRISSGGADAVTNTLIAGQVRISGTNINTTSGFPIEIPVPVNHLKGIDGDYLSLQFFGFGQRVG
jgi:hypothetical protein